MQTIQESTSDKRRPQRADATWRASVITSVRRHISHTYHTMRRFPILPAILLAGLLPVYAAGQTLPRGYELIAVTRDALRQEKPRMNNAGQIVFLSVMPGDRWEIMLYDTDGSLTQITDDDTYDSLPDIGDDGTIVWTRWIGPERNGFPTPEIMMRTPDGTITQLTDDPAEDWAPKVNALGQVVWHKAGPFACGGHVQDIYMFDGLRTVRITTDGLTDSVENQSPEINDRSEIVWTRYDFCDPPPGFNFTSKIMMYSGGAIFELTDGQQFPQAPDLNNNSQAVFDHYDPDLDLDFIDLWEKGVTTTLVVDGVNPAINDRADVAFGRWDNDRSHVDVWLYRAGALFRITRDSFDNIVPDINNETELTWGFGVNQARLDIRYMRRFDAGDVNCDGTIDAFDIEAFLAAFLDPSGYLNAYPTCDPLLADIDGSGSVNAFDIEPFLTILFE